MAITTWMIYGAYGYTGRLITGLAKEQGLTPVLAGRNQQATQEVADAFGFQARAFALDDPGSSVDNLQDIDAVIHCAGPFSSTSRPMLEACLQAKTHYFDITGEVSVFELRTQRRLINKPAMHRYWFVQESVLTSFQPIASPKLCMTPCPMRLIYPSASPVDLRLAPALPRPWWKPWDSVQWLAVMA